MATYNYYGFAQGASYYAGSYSAAVNTATMPTGSICQPGDVLKFSPGNSYGTNEIMTFALDYNLTIESMTVGDWDTVTKDKWFQSYMTKVGLSRFITDPIYAKLLSDWEAGFGFERLSGLSLAYVYQDTISLEVRLGVNLYIDTFFEDWVFTNAPSPTYGTIASDIFGTLKPGPHYISNVGKITYGTWTDFVWSFGVPNIFDEYVTLGTENLANGGGNLFAEIKLAGGYFNASNESIVNAHYIVVKNVPQDDPTKGICTYLRSKNEIGFNTNTTAYLGPFCVGDVLTVINDSVYTTRTNLTSVFTWTWFGNLYDVPTLWYLADISNPCQDYQTVPVYDMLFPLRVISECKYENFD